MRISAKIKLKHPLTIFLIKVGGVFPLLFEDGVVAIDRNILSKISGNKISKADKYWIEFLNSDKFLINPILCAYEGNLRRVPNFNEFIDEFSLASEKISKFLPGARLIQHKGEDLSGIYSVVLDLQSRQSNEVDFLLEVCPLLAEKCSDSKLSGRRDEIMKLARRFGLVSKSLSVVAVISCLYEDKRNSEKSYGRLVLKPKNDYGKGMAHNAISDLRALEFLAMSQAYGLGRISVCTADRGLAGFWRALNVWIPAPGRMPPVFNVELTSELFPRYSGKISDLRDEIFGF